MKTSLLLLLAVGCGGSTSGASDTDAGSATGDSVSGADAALAPDAADFSHYRTSLQSCWIDPSCTRALLVAHGGAWKLVDPAYGSTAAYDAAYEQNADAIKADVRFSKDDVPVVVHSSPFQAYEIDPIDFNCYGDKVEQMNASDITDCRWINGDHIQRLDALLSWARGKTIIMLTIKDLTTTAKVIDFVNAQQAADFVFLEVPSATMLNDVPNAAGNQSVFFLPEAATASDVTALLAQHHPGMLMIEDANSDGFGGVADLTTLISTQLHGAGVRAFSSISSVSASASDHQALWNQGFDVVMTNSYGSGHDARISVNTARGVTPP